jgi:hypothetical protein
VTDNKAPRGSVFAKLVIVFRGTGARISKEERAKLDPRVHVVFQPKAWVDKPVMDVILSKVLKPFFKQVREEAHAAGVPGARQRRVLLTSDNLGCQTTDRYKQTVRDIGGWSVNTPSGQTDLVQPVDAGLGYAVKRAMAEALDIWLMDPDNQELWERTDEWSCSNRRVLLTKWAADAYEKVLASNNLWRYFERCGILLTLDGSRDERITLEGMPKEMPYTVTGCSPESAVKAFPFGYLGVPPAAPAGTACACADCQIETVVTGLVDAVVAADAADVDMVAVHG